MGKTTIEWTDHSINPIRVIAPGWGHYCEKISPGCANCYASAMQHRFKTPHFGKVKTELPEGFQLSFDESKLEQVLRRKKPTKYFWCDMTDMFGWWVPDEWIDSCFAVMALTPQHTHQVLTKRPERAAEMLTQSPRHNGGSILQSAFIRQRRMKGGVQDARLWHEPDWPLPNVWIGTSVEDQKRAVERILHLLKIPAAVRFLSAEPLLAPLDLSEWFDPPDPQTIDWVIVGGESGPGARPCNLNWVRSIRDQCRAAGVMFFLKQLGANFQYEMQTAEGARMVREVFKDKKGGDWNQWPDDLRVREFPESIHMEDGEMSDELEIERSIREVIEGQLLADLNDKSKVAILLDEKELDILIAALEDGPAGYNEKDLMHTDLLKLRKAAFGR